MNMKYPVGTAWRDKHNRENVVIDYHITRNLNGDIVRERYVVQRSCGPQLIVDDNVVEVTIARGLAGV